MRRQSVAFFLGDVGFLSDPKFRKLARRLTDPDDFNSAVGAFFIALAAARRNGLPTIDASSETDSKFVPDLIAVGLMTDDGFPEKAFTGWAPSRERRPNELRRTVTNATNGDQIDRSDIPSTQLPSTPIKETTTEGGPGETDFDAQDVYHELTQYRPWGQWSGEEIKAAIRDYGNPAVEAALRAEHKRDLTRDSLWKRAKARLAKDADRARDERKARASPERPSVDNAELQRMRREVTEGVV